MKKEKRKMIEEYEVNSFTMAVIPITYGSKVYSKIYETEDEYISPFKPIDIIKSSCDYFGASYDGRKEGTRKIIGVTHKVPIAIAPSNSIFFFPTISPDKAQCIWISHEHIHSYHKGNKNCTIVTFKNNQTLEIPISYNSFQNQIYRTVMLKSKLMQRFKGSNQKTFYVSKVKVMAASEDITNYNN